MRKRKNEITLKDGLMFWVDGAKSTFKAVKKIVNDHKEKKSS